AVELHLAGLAEDEHRDLAAPGLAADHEVVDPERVAREIRDQAPEGVAHAAQRLAPVLRLDRAQRGGVDDHDAERSAAGEARRDLGQADAEARQVPAPRLEPGALRTLPHARPHRQPAAAL